MQAQIGIQPGGPVPMDRGPGTQFRQLTGLCYLAIVWLNVIVVGVFCIP